MNHHNRCSWWQHGERSNQQLAWSACTAHQKSGNSFEPDLDMCAPLFGKRRSACYFYAMNSRNSVITVYRVSCVSYVAHVLLYTTSEYILLILAQIQCCTVDYVPTKWIKLWTPWMADISQSGVKAVHFDLRRIGHTTFFLHCQILLCRQLPLD